MKKKLFAMVAGCVAVIGTANRVGAQSQLKNDPLDNRVAIEKSGPTSYGPVNGQPLIIPKALQDFIRRYKSVADPKWVINDNGIFATFFSDNTWNTAYYTTRGNWAGDIKSYGEDKVQQQQRQIVKAVYYDYSIAWVKEVESPESDGKPTYIFLVENKNDIKLVRLYGEQMDVISEYEKL